MTAYLIEPVDTWFFREARPFDVVGGTELSSQFPPPARTVASALHQARSPGSVPRSKEQPFDPPSVRGPYIAYRKPEAQGYEPLYPAPLDLLGREDGGFVRLAIPEKPVRCDLGNVLLPKLDKQDRGAKPLDSHWLDGEQLKAYLQGEMPKNKPVEADGLFTVEPRIGLARVNARRVAEEGMLFSTRHLRLAEGGANTALLLDVGWPEPEGRWEGGLLKFGGEGRLASARLHEEGIAALPEPQAKGGERGLILLLLTHAQLGPVPMPPGLVQTERTEQTQTGQTVRTVWTGPLRYRKAGKEGTVELTAECAVIGKAQREGGWNPAKKRPRRVRSLVPAGSLWYCTLPDQTTASLNEAIAKLHGAQIGEDTHFGRGELAVGLWQK